jgi:Heterokaryon incompatibility protein (HET)
MKLLRKLIIYQGLMFVKSAGSAILCARNQGLQEINYLSFGAATTVNLSQCELFGQKNVSNINHGEMEVCSPCAVVESDKYKSDNLYHRLPGPDWFRLLYVEPGCLEDPITCSLGCFRQSSVTLIYECLSYCWRSSDLDWDEDDKGEEVYPITCNGISMSIHYNLWHALKRIRKEDRTRILWVDRIWFVYIA